MVGQNPYASANTCVVTGACAAVNSNGGCQPVCANMPSTTVCRAADPSNPCSAPTYCDGVSAYCPVSTLKADGVTCSKQTAAGMFYGTCYNGACGHPHEKICKTNLGNNGCSIPGYECVPACQYPNQQCIQLSFNCDVWINGSAVAWTNNLACSYDPLGTPCAASGTWGTCRGGTVVDTAGPCKVA